MSLLVDERAARLDDRVRELLATAAEVGDEFDFDVLVSATEAGGDVVLDALEQGLAADLLVESGASYRFAHPLFRSMLRKAIPPRARPALHLRIARTIAGGVDPTSRRAIEAAGLGGMNLLAVADHAATAAELGERAALELAVGFGLAAGTRQGELFAFEAAVSTIRRAIALWYRLGADDRAGFPASSGLVALGWALHGNGDLPGASEAFASAATVAATDAERATAWIAAAWMPYQHGGFARADELLRQGLETIADPVARASLEVDRAWIGGRLGRWREARESLERAVPLLQGADDALVARSLDRLGVAVRDTGEPARSVPILERAASLAVAAHDTRLEATILQHLAGSMRLLERLDEARALSARAIELSALAGDRYMESVSEWIAGEVDHAAGDLAGARRHRSRELEILAATGGNPQNEAMAHAHLANLARLAGDDVAFEREAEAARAAAAHSGVQRLVRRIEAALATSDWFDAGAHTEAGAHEA